MKQLTITDKGYTYLQHLLASLTILSASQLQAATLEVADELEIGWVGTDTTPVQVTLPAPITPIEGTITVTLPTDAYDLISHQATHEFAIDTQPMLFN